MFFAWLGCVNTYFTVALFYFFVHVSSFQLLDKWVLDQNIIVQCLPALIPFGYVMLLFCLVFASMTFKADARNPRTISRYAQISACIGMYQLLIYGIVMTNLVINYLLNNTGYYSNGSADVIKIIIVVIVLTLLGSYVWITLIHPHLIWDIVRSTIVYIYYTSIYMHTLLI